MCQQEQIAQMKICSENGVVCRVGDDKFSELKLLTELFQQGKLEEKIN